MKTLEIAFLSDLEPAYASTIKKFVYLVNYLAV
jgi:hypothetical protein